jgi:hypothetical protein
MGRSVEGFGVIWISIAEQRLRWTNHNGDQKDYMISTAKNGAGEIENSGCTPRGRHVVAQKIGAGLPMNSVLVGRVPTGEIYNEALAAQYPARDWILSRILWLAGLEAGINQGAGCDSHARYIYIHGTPDTEPMGEPCSHGCIRMRNDDVIELFDAVYEGTPVQIVG